MFRGANSVSWRILGQPGECITRGIGGGKIALEIKTGSDTCKASALTPVLTLWPMNEFLTNISLIYSAIVMLSV